MKAAWAAGLGLVLAFLPSVAAASPFWPVSPQTEQARSIVFLFWLVMGIAMVLGAGVLITLGLIIFRFRGRPGQADPAPRYGNLKLEAWWTALPVAVLVAVFVMMVREVNKEVAIPSDALTVDVIGHQWWWEYRYPDNTVAANELHVPAGKAVRLNLQTADVIHTFWVPELNGKMQMIPGQNDVWNFTPEKPGTYDGACSEYCGAQHGWMRLSVVADSQADYDRWLAAQKAAPAPSVVQGHSDALRLYAANACGGCHTIQGVSDGKVAPDLTHIGGRATIGAGVLQNTPDNMARWMADPQQFKPGSLMPNFHFSQEDARAMASFLEDLK